jgi:hypothetical protein
MRSRFLMVSQHFSRLFALQQLSPNRDRMSASQRQSKRAWRPSGQGPGACVFGDGMRSVVLSPPCAKNNFEHNLPFVRNFLDSLGRAPPGHRYYSGPKLMPTVPNTTGATLPAALAALSNQNLPVGNISVLPNANISSGSIVSSSPAGGTVLPNPTPVDLVISSGSGGWRELLAQNYQAVTFNLLAACVLGLLGLSLWKGGAEFYDRLADQNTARGLITFLITATSAALFIILAISTIVGTSDGDSDKRFDRSKQILTMLVGILGTIIGFYFGTANASTPPITITDLKVDPLKPGKGGTFTISGTIAGGKAPYSYSIAFEPKLTFPVIADKPSPGKFSEPFTVPADLAKDQDVEYRVTIKDVDGKTQIIKGDRSINLKASPQQQEGPTTKGQPPPS